MERPDSSASFMSSVSLGRPGGEAGVEANGLGGPGSPSKLSDELARRLAVADSNPAQPQASSSAPHCWRPPAPVCMHVCMHVAPASTCDVLLLLLPVLLNGPGWLIASRVAHAVSGVAACPARRAAFTLHFLAVARTWVGI